MWLFTLWSVFPVIHCYIIFFLFISITFLWYFNSIIGMHFYLLFLASHVSFSSDNPLSSLTARAHGTTPGGLSWCRNLVDLVVARDNVPWLSFCEIISIFFFRSVLLTLKFLSPLLQSSMSLNFVCNFSSVFWERSQFWFPNLIIYLHRYFSCNLLQLFSCSYLMFPTSSHLWYRTLHFAWDSMSTTTHSSASLCRCCVVCFFSEKV